MRKSSSTSWAAVHLTATHAARLLPDYHFDPATGLWRHRAAPPVRTGLRYDMHRVTGGGRRRVSAGVLPGYLRAARVIFAAHNAPAAVGGGSGGAGVADAFDRLRWFTLPVECLAAG